MISRAAAILIAAQNFPHGPESLASHLGVLVQSSDLVGVEGWCIRGPNTIIRINASSTLFRQRFTLAHELAHLILGTEPDIAIEPFRSDSHEERDADQLASELLIPDEQLHLHLRGQLPIDAKTLERLAKAADVSPLVAASRVVNATETLGLQNAAIVFFADGREKWRQTRGLRFNRRQAERLFQEAMASKPSLARAENGDGKIVVGSIIDAQSYQVLLLQLLSQETAAQVSREERCRQIASELFGDDYVFRQSVAGCLSAVKQKCTGRTLDAAIQFFAAKYVGSKFTGAKAAKLNSSAGLEYVRLCLERWFT
ncbi:MAG: ImmA/IrrE family metallo-endopeptidase [Planctomycetia bacterium]|nr:ImmA/IrrE family metallo-endopeptidase [Planctomycetia bacterium]